MGRITLFGMWGGLLVGAATGAGAQPAASAAQVPPVETRARVASVDPEAPTAASAVGAKRYIRLQLVPRARLPFSTLAFRVRDPALVSGIAPGVWVKFTAGRVEGENTLMSIRVVAECKRFEACD